MFSSPYQGMPFGLFMNSSHILNYNYNYVTLLIYYIHVLFYKTTQASTHTKISVPNNLVNYDLPLFIPNLLMHVARRSGVILKLCF